MPTLNDLIDGDAQRLDTGFTFTEGPLYHPNGFYYFVDVRELKFYRIKPGEKAELLRENMAKATVAYALPCRRFAVTLAGASARLGADADRYSFTVVDFPPPTPCRF